MRTATPPTRRWIACGRLRRHTAIRCFAAAIGAIVVLATGGCVDRTQHQAIRHIERGDAFLEEEKLEAALTEFQTAAKLAPQMAVAHSRMGVIYQRMGEYAHAVECLIEAIRIDPFSFDETFKLAQLHHVMHRLSEAIQAYLHAVELKPDDFDAQLNLGVCYQEIGDFEQAVERFHRAIGLNPDRAHAFLNLGVALDAQQKYYEAIRAYKEALEREIHQPLVLVNLAHTYMNQDRLKLARLALEQAIRLDPQFASAHETLGYCLFCMRNFADAERSYKRALAYEWRLPRSHVGLGSIDMLGFLKNRTETNLHARALEHWHRSLELDPDQPRIRKLIARYRPKYNRPEQVLLDEQSPP